MNSFIVESFKEFSRVHFYTVRWDEQEDSETDRFLARYMNDETYKEELIEILTLIEDIGENRGRSPFCSVALKTEQLPYHPTLSSRSVELCICSLLTDCDCTVCV